MAVNRTVTTAVIAAAAAASVAGAEFVSYEGDPDGWFVATGAWTEITFTEFPVGTQVTDQYAGLGVTFSGIANFVEPGFDRDDAGLFGDTMITMEFDTVMHAFSGYHPGFQRMRFYLGEEVLFTSDDLGGSGTDFFSGFVSDVGFDRVDTIGFSANPNDLVFYDDLYFSTIPAPGALALLAGLAVQRRRRA